MTENKKEDEIKPKKKINLGARIVMAIIGAVFIFQGISQMRSGIEGINQASEGGSRTKITGVVGNTVRDEKSKLSVSFPDSWIVAEATEEMPFRAGPGKGGTDFRMTREEVPENCTAQFYFDSMNNLLSNEGQVTDYTVISSKPFQVAGLDGIRQVQTMKVNENREIVVKQTSVVFVKDRVAYCAIASSTQDEFATAEPAFDKILASIKFE